jgi:hypothetical protein
MLTFLTAEVRTRGLHLVALALAAGTLSACGSSSGSKMPTTGAYAPIKPAPILPVNENGIDPGVLSRSGSDILTVVRRVGVGAYRAGGINHYQLEVTNTSSIGFVNTFEWLPPRGTSIVAVTASSTGHCMVSNGGIVCRVALRPPTCTCRGDGGRVTIDFTARVPPDKAGHEAGFVGASLDVRSLTPVPYIIPSSPLEKPGVNSDLPLCTHGKHSTPREPCIRSS